MQERLTLRPARQDDADLLFAWRNDPAVRQASRQQGQIEYASHCAWLEKSLCDPGRRIYIAEADGIPVGTARADFADGAHELSWTIAPEARGRGLGTRMVALLAELVAGPVRAEVRVGNAASARIAEHVGMKLVRIQDGMMHFHRDGPTMPRDCPICCARSLPSYQKGAYAYCRCMSCGAVFVAADLRAEDVHARYSRDYFEASQADSAAERLGYPSYLGMEESLKRSFAHKLEVIRGLAPHGRLLDVGAAYGTFLSMARSVYDCHGLDVSAHAVQMARSQYGLAVDQGSIEQSTRFEDGWFDLVVMWDVIEHLIDPVGGLREVRRILKPGGYLAISTDDVAHWLPRLLGRQWWGLAAPLHVCHFTRRSMAVAVERAGGFGSVRFVRDTRVYRLAELVGHFGVSFRSRRLTELGRSLEASPIGRWAISVTRPEQFIAIARRQEGGEA